MIKRKENNENVINIKREKEKWINLMLVGYVLIHSLDDDLMKNVNAISTFHENYIFFSCFLNFDSNEWKEKRWLIPKNSEWKEKKTLRRKEIPANK